MKTDRILAFAPILVLLLGTLMFQSCDKDPPPVVPEELKPTLEVSQTPTGVLPYGSKITISWTTQNAKSIKINDVTQSGVISGSATFERICSNVLYKVKATNISLSTEKEIEVNIGDWTTSKFGLISYYPWTPKEFRIILAKDSSIVYREEPTAEEKTRIFYYHKNGDLTNNYLTTTGQWSISDDGKNLIRGGVSKSFSVSKDELSTYQETTWDGKPAYFLNVFKHASDTPTDK